MNDFLELAKRRQTCREFADRPVEHEKLAKCVEAARLAPSGCNAQPWSFVVVESPDMVGKAAECVAMNGMNPYAAQAKAFVVILEEHAKLMPQIACMLDSQYFAKGDLGAAAAYFCLEAESQGLGTCQFGIYDRPKLGQLLGIPEHKQYAALIGIGYPANPEVRIKQRKPLDQLVRSV
ncbi:MAG: nitroreductase family protein [Planctomycetota bacterium]|jgi:nitroreductase|nr:nitroreductase family protein [Planctomycetota bacterium]